jgi:feruloyl esterase
VDGAGNTFPSRPIPSAYDRFGMLIDWVENKKAPGKSVTVTAGERSLPMCSYPMFPKYIGGPTGDATSYICAAK